MAWLITVASVVGYLALVLVVGRITYVQLDERRRPRSYDLENSTLAVWAGIGWPLALVAFTAWAAWKVTVERETPRQRRERLSEEREAAQKAAREFDLPAPDDPEILTWPS